ncbi:hypothetical protein [uncultured Aquimarina sp.]|uniref:hypothetical protein n=1 Tax=uncultured Aquimarina sp. TaxID=575652 RepID=UPI00262C19A0|nr:hypothetical protein [uncultured Aquimarina sp.]
MEVIEKQSISLPKTPILVCYDIQIAEEVIIGGNSSNQLFSYKATKELIKVDEIGFLYSIKVEEDTYTNSDPNTIQVKELSIIHHNLVLYTNIHGQIIDVVNSASIKEEWETDMDKIISKYKTDSSSKETILNIKNMLSEKKHFLEYIKNHYLVKALFPDIYYLEFGKQLINNSKVREPMTSIELPIQMTGTVTLDKNSDLIKILQIGKLNDENFDGQPIKKVLREMYDIPNMPVEINLNIFETCELNSSFLMIEKVNCQEIQIGPEYLIRHAIKTNLIKKER